VKFLCDRCKTRYSIGDDRVRGKILKIRCKNCANVITVREGMPEPDAGTPAAGAPRRNKTTTAAPVVQAEASAKANNGALGAAFASAMTKPPPALEEEWYVSIDGDQSGPYSLSEAQRWVGAKPFDADLHCWSEGFDDWLPVDKVSHFRGLRKRPPTVSGPSAMPPPIPRVGGTGPARALASAPVARVEDEPKPLFAATMASLEKSATPSASLAATGGGAAVSALRVEARAPVPTPVPVPKPHVNGNAPRPNLPAAKPVATVKGVGLGPKPLGFDASEAAFTDEAPTTTEPPPEPHLKSVDPTAAPNDAFFDALAKSRAEAKAAAKPQISLSALASPSTANEAPTLRADGVSGFPDARKIENETENEDLDIGEVSRVVKLADLAKPSAAKSPAQAQKRSGQVGRLTGPVAKVGGLTGAVPKINGTGAVPLIDAVEARPSGNIPIVAEPVAEPPPHSKRGMIILLISAALLLGVAAVIVVIKLSKPDDVTGLGTDYEYNATRPDNPINVRPQTPGSATEPPQNPFIPKPPRNPPRNPNPGSGRIIDPPAGNSLRSDEIEAMARSTSATTTACFRRADKGADAIRLADVKKIRVTFKINPDGSVSPGSVALSENGSVTLTSCIQRMVGGWKFRPNAGGDFGFVFAKPD
jgi:predicted Zn finger-like uncharacterized protein